MKKSRHSPNDEEFPGPKQSKWPLYISIGVVATIVLGYFFVPSVKSFLQEFWMVFTSGDEGRAHQWVSQFGNWGPMVVVLVMVLQMFLIVIPTPLLMVITILAFGPVWGSTILMVAEFTASSVGYFVGKYFSGPAEKLIGHKTQRKISGFIGDYGIWTVIVIKLSPFLSNDAISFVAGILKMGYWKFIGASLAGVFPLIVLIAILRENYEIMDVGLIWASVVSIVLFAGFIFWDKKIRQNKS